MQGLKPFLLMLLFHSGVQSVELGGALKEEISKPKVRILLGLDRHKNVENLKLELKGLESRWKDFASISDQKHADVLQQISELQSIAKTKNTHWVQKKIQFLHRLEHVIEEIKEVKEKNLEILQHHIDFWDRYFSDDTALGSAFEEKSIYSFLDFQNMIKRLFMQEEYIKDLFVQKEHQLMLISREEHVVASKEKEFHSIVQIIEEKKQQNDINKDDIALLDIEKEVVAKERELASLRLNSYQKQLEFLSSKESIMQEQLQLFKEQSETVRNRLYIDISDVKSYAQKDDLQRQACETKKADLIKLRQDVAIKKLQNQEDLDRLRHRFKMSINSLKQIEDIEFKEHSISDSFALYAIAQAYSTVVTYDRMLLKIKSEILLQDFKIKQSSATYQAIKLLYEISQGRVKDTETFERERIAYQQMRKTILADIKNFKDEALVVKQNIQDLQKILMHVRKQQEKVKSGAPVGSGSSYKKWSETNSYIEIIIKQLEEQHEILLQGGELQAQMLNLQEETLECIDTILHEFNVIGVWHRSMSAVTWEGFKNILPNLGAFLKGVYVIITTYLSQVTLQKIANELSHLGVAGVLSIFLLCFIIFFIYLLLQAGLPALYKSLISIDDNEVDILYRSRQLFAIVVGFFIEVLKPLYIWFLFLMYEFWFDAPIAMLIAFYVFSIVFWIYASHRLLYHVIMVNRKFDYMLLSKRLIDRFSLVFSFFAISTIIILVMRKMFMVVMLHQQTELPSILLRMYHVVIFISIIFSLDKEELLQLLPRRSLFSQKIAAVLERYYYLFLLGLFSLLVMSDPYLGGYGSLMWHMFWSLFLTISLLGVLFLAHTIIKQSSLIFFFKDDDNMGIASERFEYAKTWYAIYVIILMFSFTIVAIVSSAHIWGYGFTYGTLRKIVMFELFKIETVNSVGKVIPDSFKIINLLYIILMSAIGVVVAYLFKKFVLQRVFDIQYVDPGVQNTVTIISRYLIISIAVMIACVQSNLGYVVYYVSFVGLATFGWAFKDLFTDFVAYFFILVQRPLKLGDYVKIDDDTMGVVRKIGSRAVVLRRQNAVNIVVPNSTILKSSMYNWNYTRNYIGIEEILFSVPFGSNIQLVKEICFQVLDEDHDILKVPQPVVRLQEFGDKGYVFMVRGFLSSGNTLRQWDIASNIRFALVAKLAKAGIMIAGPSIRIIMKQELISQGLDV